MTCDDCKESAQRLIESQQRLIFEQSITIKRLRKRLDRFENPPVVVQADMMSEPGAIKFIDVEGF